MATKLKRFSRSKITKVMAFLLVVISITAIVLEIQYNSYRQINTECLVVENYKDSEEFINDYVIDAIYYIADADLINMKKTPLDKGNYIYYLKKNNVVYTNVLNADKSYFENFDKAFFSFENGTFRVGKNTSEVQNPYSYLYNLSGCTMYLAFSDDFLNEKQAEWVKDRNEIMPVAKAIIALSIVSLLLIIYLICVTGRKSEDEKLHLLGIDRIYTDIELVFLIGIICLWIIFVSNIYLDNGVYPKKLDMNEVYSMVIISIVTAISTLGCGVIILSLVRKIKDFKLLKHSLVYRFLYKMYKFIGRMFKSFAKIFSLGMFEEYPLTKALYYRQIVFAAGSGFLMFFTFVFRNSSLMFLIFVISEASLIYWYIKGNNITFAKINEGFNESLEEQMKAERMKLDLVTNVSHDLKTPLTSIISYVDLLSKEENLSESASDYIRILAEKSNRLKNIVADLFDLAKSTSGDIVIELETLDINKLITQTLGDMEDEIEKSNLQIKTKLPDKPIMIISDGKKLYRVFQNIIDNALKYSLKGSRIYVELSEIDGRAVATIKNTSGYEMDFTEEEILQRFNRGDKSRTTEGSGLGLSIAQSFTTVCNGTFQVDIDGDLFKVTISFKI